MSLRCFV